MRQIGTVVGNLVNIEKPRAGNMRLDVFFLSVASGLRQIPRAVEYAEIWVFEMRGEPVC